MTNRKQGIILSYLTVFVKNISLLIYTQVLLHFFGKSEYGLYQMSNSIISNLSLLNLGFSFAYIKFYTELSVKKNELRIRKLNGTYLLFFLFISLISLLVGSLLIINSNNFFSPHGNYEQLKFKRLMFLMIINVIVTFINSPFESTIIAQEQFVFQQIRQMLQSIFLPVLTIPIILFVQADIVFVTMVQTFISVISLLFNISFCIKKIGMKFSFRNLEFSFIKKISLFSFFIFLNQLFNQINTHAPVFILGIWANTKQVAVYSIVNQLNGLFLTFSQVLTTVFIPKINKLVHQTNDSVSLTKLMVKIGQYQIVVLGLLLGGFIVLGKMFLYVWLGKGFTEVYYLLISIVIPLFVPLSQNIAIEIQQARNQHFFRSIVLTIFSFLNIGITVFCIKLIGIYGSTFGYIFSLIVGYGIVMNWYYQKKMDLDMKLFWANTLPCFLPVVLSTIIIKILSLFFYRVSILSFILLGSLYCVVYGGVIYLLLPHIFQKLTQVFSEKVKRD